MLMVVIIMLKMEFTFGRLEQGIDMVSGMNNKDMFQYLDKGVI